MILTNSLHGVSQRDVGKEPRHNRCESLLSLDEQAQSTLETFPTCMSVPGIPQGQPPYQRALHNNNNNNNAKALDGGQPSLPSSELVLRS